MMEDATPTMPASPSAASTRGFDEAESWSLRDTANSNSSEPAVSRQNATERHPRPEKGSRPTRITGFANQCLGAAGRKMRHGGHVLHDIFHSTDPTGSSSLHTRLPEASHAMHSQGAPVVRSQVMDAASNLHLAGRCRKQAEHSRKRAAAPHNYPIDAGSESTSQGSSSDGALGTDQSEHEDQSQHCEATIDGSAEPFELADGPWAQEVTHSAWLFKRGPTLDFMWERFWCVLHPLQLVYYEDKDCTKKKGAIRFGPTARVHHVAHHTAPGDALKHCADRQHAFVFDPDPQVGKCRRLFYFDPSTEADLEIWNQAVHRAAHFQSAMGHFQQFDSDSNGSIDEKEFYQVLRKFNHTVWTRKRAQKMLADVDTDHDGRIQFEELAHYISTANTLEYVDNRFGHSIKFELQAGPRLIKFVDGHRHVGCSDDTSGIVTQLHWQNYDAFGGLVKDQYGCAEWFPIEHVEWLQGHAEKARVPHNLPVALGVLGTCPAGHELVPKASKNHGPGWMCAAVDEPFGCRSDITTPKHSHGQNRFHCKVCDFSVCRKCFVSRVGEARCPMGHHLVCESFKRDLYSWSCDARNGKCATVDSVRFFCSDCNYNSCRKCVTKQHCASVERFKGFQDHLSTLSKVAETSFAARPLSQKHEVVDEYSGLQEYTMNDLAPLAELVDMDDLVNIHQGLALWRRAIKFERLRKSPSEVCVELCKMLVRIAAEICSLSKVRQLEANLKARKKGPTAALMTLISSSRPKQSERVKRHRPSRNSSTPEMTSKGSTSSQLPAPTPKDELRASARSSTPPKDSVNNGPSVGNSAHKSGRLRVPDRKLRKARSSEDGAPKTRKSSKQSCSSESCSLGQDDRDGSKVMKELLAPRKSARDGAIKDDRVSAILAFCFNGWHVLRVKTAHFDSMKGALQCFFEIGCRALAVSCLSSWLVHVHQCHAARNKVAAPRIEYETYLLNTVGIQMKLGDQRGGANTFYCGKHTRQSNAGVCAPHSALNAGEQCLHCAQAQQRLRDAPTSDNVEILKVRDVDDSTPHDTWKRCFVSKKFTRPVCLLIVIGNWKDQGWGDVGGQIQARLLRGSQEVFSQDLFGIFRRAAGQSDWQFVERWLGQDDLILSSAMPGDCFELRYRVGAAARELHLQNFRCHIHWSIPKSNPEAELTYKTLAGESSANIPRPRTSTTPIELANQPGEQYLEKQATLLLDSTEQLGRIIGYVDQTLAYNTTRQHVRRVGGAQAGKLCGLCFELVDGSRFGHFLRSDGSELDLLSDKDLESCGVEWKPLEFGEYVVSVKGCSSSSSELPRTVELKLNSGRVISFGSTHNSNSADHADFSFTAELDHEVEFANFAKGTCTGIGTVPIRRWSENNAAAVSTAYSCAADTICHATMAASLHIGPRQIKYALLQAKQLKATQAAALQDAVQESYGMMFGPQVPGAGFEAGAKGGESTQLLSLENVRFHTVSDIQGVFDSTYKKAVKRDRGAKVKASVPSGFTVVEVSRIQNFKNLHEFIVRCREIEHDLERRSPIATCERGHRLVSWGDRSGTYWACHARHWPNGCQNGITRHGQAKGIHRYRCGECDYDICKKCFEAESKRMACTSMPDIKTAELVSRPEDGIVGRWQYAGTEGSSQYRIVLEDGRLYFKETHANDYTVKGELVKGPEWYEGDLLGGVLSELCGCIRMKLEGENTIRSNFKTDDSPWSNDTIAHRSEDWELDKEANCAWLFHGTGEDTAKSILDGTYCLERCGASAFGGMYGRGIYLSDSCSTADESCQTGADGLRTMLICRTALGRVLYSDEAEPDQAKLVNQCVRGSFHSVFGNRGKRTSREFIVYDRDQVYPEFLVKYRRRHVRITSENELFTPQTRPSVEEQDFLNMPFQERRC